MPPITTRSRRRDYVLRREAGEPNPLARGKPYSDIRPTHVDAYGLRYQIPVSPPYGESVEVPVFYPSDDQMARRCDGCARSHQNNNARCGANAFVSLESSHVSQYLNIQV
tara:strand:- start:299 stop:628 length:330 start_codon:yes stop_codon:yes gene_type:complete